jgi:hypothetical protein
MKLAIGVYGLRGANIPPGVVESLKTPQRSGTILKDFGWTPEGKIWLVHELSKGMVTSGFFGIPPSMKKFLQGDFILKTADGALIGPLRIKETSGWSLIQLFKRRGGEAGDYLLLIFDLSLREVEARMGDEDLLDDYQLI